MAAKKKQRRNPKRQRAPLWPTLVAIGVILLGIVWNDRDKEARNRNDASCGLIMAESTFHNGGWGMFVLTDVPRDSVVGFGEVVIQLTDLWKTKSPNLQILLDDYVWDPYTGGGISEGSNVFSVVPGIGALANGHPEYSNVASYVPETDHGGVTRSEWPGAGALTHYHNKLYHTTRSLQAGDEVVVSYGSKWTGNVHYQDNVNAHREVKDLREHGLCLDHIQPGPSTILGAGRGAFATRPLRKGQVIAPAPLIPILSRDALVTRRNTTKNGVPVDGHQLLLNYCYGHANSSILFFPYAPVVNLINHSPSNPNAKMQWSESSSLHVGKEWLEWPLEKLKAEPNTGLLLEIVATRDVQPGEEILMDYGSDWQEAWDQHVATWKPDSDDSYRYPFELQDDEQFLTQADNAQYPPNVQTACFYHYGDHVQQGLVSNDSPTPWHRTHNTIRVKSERPCILLSRDAETNTYTVEMGNNNNNKVDAVPPHHVVSGVPRSSIILTNKRYTSDQHLPNAFRFQIGIPDDIFPTQWMDILQQ